MHAEAFADFGIGEAVLDVQAAHFLHLGKGQLCRRYKLADRSPSSRNTNSSHGHFSLLYWYQELATVPALPSSEETADMPGLIAPAVARAARASFW